MSGIVQAKILGGFGNQLHQYAAVRMYAQAIGATLETNDWVGRYIFCLSDPTWSCDLPEMNGGCSGSPPTVEWGQTNIRLVGYFQTQRWVGKLSRREVRQWFRFRQELLDLVPRRDGVYTAIHVRQGDYFNNPQFANVSERSCQSAAEKLNLPQPIVWVKQDAAVQDPRVPQSCHFLPDFLTLVRATVIVRANSTFSWWAATLGSGVVFSPVVEDHTGPYDAEFVAGNWPKCAHSSRCGVQIDDLFIGD
jgi:hypothetical protein